MTMQPRVLAKSAAPREFTGLHMLLVMGAFFGVVIAVNVTMAVLSSTSWPGLAVANSYVASQEYQGRLDAAREQHALGWVAEFDYAAGVARFTIDDNAANPVDIGVVTLTVNRPVGTAGDQTVELPRLADGSYSASLELASGTWDAVITAPDTGRGPFELRRCFKVE
jgi:nitrogen fixation protein FixH